MVQSFVLTSEAPPLKDAVGEPDPCLQIPLLLREDKAT